MTARSLMFLIKTTNGATLCSVRQFPAPMNEWLSRVNGLCASEQRFQCAGSSRTTFARLPSIIGRSMKNFAQLLNNTLKTLNFRKNCSLTTCAWIATIARLAALATDSGGSLSCFFTYFIRVTTSFSLTRLNCIFTPQLSSDFLKFFQTRVTERRCFLQI